MDEEIGPWDLEKFMGLRLEVESQRAANDGEGGVEGKKVEVGGDGECCVCMSYLYVQSSA